MANVKISALPSSSAITNADEFVVQQAAETLRLGADQLIDYAYVPPDGRWQQLAAGAFAATPISESQMTITDTSVLGIGYPIRWKQPLSTHGDTFLYGVIGTVDSGVGVSIYGPMILSQDISEVWIGNPELVLVERYFVDGNIDTLTESTTEDLFGLENHSYRWWGPTAYLVYARVISDLYTPVGSGEGYQVHVAPMVDGQYAYYAKSGRQVVERYWSQVSSQWLFRIQPGRGLNVHGSWVGYRYGTGIRHEDYQVSYGSRIGLAATSAWGSNAWIDDAAKVSVQMTFVLE